MVLDYEFIQTVLAALGGGGLFGASGYLLKRHFNRITVKLISEVDDEDLDDFIELYEEVIDENTRITPEEIKRFIGNHLPTHYSTLSDYIFLCKQGNHLIGFLKAIYCHESKLLFIAYLGIDKNHDKARKLASSALLLSLTKYIKKNLNECKAVFFEVEMPKDASKKTRSLSRLRLFKLATSRLKLNCYQVGINYIQPEMPTDVGSTKEENTILLFVPLNSKNITELKKEDVLFYLNFIYFKIYGRTYNDDELQQLNKIYLSGLLEKFEKELPLTIKLN